MRDPSHIIQETIVNHVGADKSRAIVESLNEHGWVLVSKPEFTRAISASGERAYDFAPEVKGQKMTLQGEVVNEGRRIITVNRELAPAELQWAKDEAIKRAEEEMGKQYQSKLYTEIS